MAPHDAPSRSLGTERSTTPASTTTLEVGSLLIRGALLRVSRVHLLGDGTDALMTAHGQVQQITRHYIDSTAVLQKCAIGWFS